MSGIATPTTEKDWQALLASGNFDSYVQQVAREGVKGGVSDAIGAAVERAVAKARLPERPSLTGQGGDAGQVPAMSPDDIRALMNGGTVKARSYLKTYSPYSPSSVAYGGQASGFKHIAELFIAARNFRIGGQLDPRLKAAALAEGSGDTGGFLVPEEFRQQLLSLALEDETLRARCTVIPMASQMLKIPTIRDISHVSSVFGGITAYWEGEAQSLLESEPSFSEAVLTAKKLTAFTVASNEILQDSAISLSAIIAEKFPAAVAFFRGRAYWTGTGAGMPLGILNAPALYAVAKESGQASGTVIYENIVNMYAHMLPTSAKNAVWYCHPSVLPQLAQLSLSVGTGGSAIFVNPMNGGAQNDFPMSIFGRPLYVSEHLNAVGSQGDIVFCDPSYYLVGDRMSLNIESSEHVRFQNDQVVWRMVLREDARPWIDSALTLSDGSFSVSPFVATAAR